MDWNGNHSFWVEAELPAVVGLGSLTLPIPFHFACSVMIWDPCQEAWPRGLVQTNKRARASLPQHSFLMLSKHH